MSEASRSRRVLRFGAFQCDLSTGELRRNGTRVYLPDQPLRVLTMLLERPSELVTRQELQGRLWPGQEYGLFDDGLNTAMNRLRNVLNDKAGKPRFIETIPRHGYRFIAAVETVTAENGPLPDAGAGQKSQEAGPAADVPRPAGDGTPTQEANAKSGPQTRETVRLWLKRTLWGLAAALGLFALWWFTPLPPPSITRIDQITVGARIDRPVKPTSDEGHIYYIARDGDHWNLMQTSLSGGDGQRVDLSLPGGTATVLDVSPRDSTLLLATGTDEGQVWTMPGPGGPATGLSNIAAACATFSPDGQSIAYTHGDTLWAANADGANVHKLADLPHLPSWLAWSPDGRQLRFTVGVLFNNSEISIWEISSDGRNLHRLLAGWSHPASECCGSWTRDGRYYVFTSSRGGHANLWALREHGRFLRRSPRGPFQLTTGPGSPFGGTLSRDPARVLFYNGIWQAEMETLNIQTGQLSSFYPGSQPSSVAFTRDHKWMVYADTWPNGGLFRSRLDGVTDRVRLASADLNPAYPRWSPDGRWVAFAVYRAGEPGRVYFVPGEGGALQELLPGTTAVRDPEWSNDGKRLVVCHRLGQSETTELLIVDFATRQAEKVPGSEDLWGPQWSPEGSYIAATSGSEVKLWSVKLKRWEVIARGKAFGFGVWSPDGRYLYYQDLLGKGQALFRYEVQNRHAEAVADFSGYLKSGVSRCALAPELAPDGSPVIVFNRSFYDLFAAEVRWP
jgi:Tol biopolymer transport system component/DNA-binding winged helix-turn-helix (wHTH) protein